MASEAEQLAQVFQLSFTQMSNLSLMKCDRWPIELLQNGFPFLGQSHPNNAAIIQATFFLNQAGRLHAINQSGYIGLRRNHFVRYLINRDRLSMTAKNAQNVELRIGDPMFLKQVVKIHRQDRKRSSKVQKNLLF